MGFTQGLKDWIGPNLVYHESSLPRRHIQGLATSQATQWTVVTMHLNHCYKQSKSFPLRLVLLGSPCNHLHILHPSPSVLHQGA